MFVFQGNGKKTSYGSGSFEKHDFGDMKFSQPDATEKDDSKEKENLNKDDNSAEYSSPLDMEYDKLETKLNLEGRDAELGGNESAMFDQSDSAPLLEKDQDKYNSAEEGTKAKTNGDTAARERKKGESSY